MTKKANNDIPSAYRLQDDELEKLLLSGERGDLVEQYLGEAEYEELQTLAREANVASVRGGPRVLILPGIMGSKIGRQGRFFDDILWIDPFEISLGGLKKLALSAKPTQLKAVGVILFAYLKLKLRLKSKGYDAEFYPFDWRQDIGSLGKQLAERLNREKHSHISLVAHSMGGLVARAAIAHQAPKVQRVVMLGTPNHGSFVPVLALRGTYPIVRKIAALDLRHDAAYLASKVFNTFPGLYQMLPFTERYKDLDLYDLKSWPATGPRPLDRLLKSSLQTQQILASADERFFLIAGVNQETVTGLRKDGDDFIYESSIEGDGTVPLMFAELSGAQTYYVEESHGRLPNNRLVENAVAEILAEGSTQMLPIQWSPTRRGIVRVFRDEELRVPAFDGRQGDAIRSSEIRRLLEEVVSPGRGEKMAPAGASSAETPSTGGNGYAHQFSRIVVGRRRQLRIDIRLALGSITEVDSRAYVLGIFRDVEPSGPARALNNRLDGLITSFTSRRMISGNLGEVFLMPTGRYSVRADMILFAGLGPFDRFSDDAQQLCAENTIRTFIASRTEEFATVLMGAGSVRSTTRSLENLLMGFFHGLRDADVEGRFRRITFCEFNRTRYDEIKEELFRLSSTALFEDIEVTLDEIVLPQMIEPEMAPRHLALGPEPIYLIVRQEDQTKQSIEFRSSVLTSGEKATVISGVRSVVRKDLDTHLRQIESRQFTFAKLDRFGSQLSELVLAPEVMAVLPTMIDHPVVVVHDAPSSRIPWETIRIKQWSPAVNAGLSRRYVADNLSVAKWLENRRYGRIIDLLLVVNPTQDLPGAEEEGDRIRDLFGTHPGVDVTELRGPDATKGALEKNFKSGEYDVVHYAGHAFFDPDRPARSGIVCHGRQVLSGSELAGLGNLPSLVFFNACEAGRVRRPDDRQSPDISKRIKENVGLAEAFLRGGVANYVGTYWPVGDVAAKSFAETFYPALLGGSSISQALLVGRKAVWHKKSVDWADYIHYGSPHFILKQLA